MRVVGIDHIVLTVRDMTRTLEFYQRVLGMRHVVFEGKFNALHFGNAKINLHPFRAEYLPHADIPAPGTGDMCLVCARTLLSNWRHMPSTSKSGRLIKQGREGR